MKIKDYLKLTDYERGYLAGKAILLLKAVEVKKYLKQLRNK